MKEFQLAINFFQCKNFDLAIFESLTRLMYDKGFIFEQNFNGSMQKLQTAGRFNELIKRQYSVFTTDDMNIPIKWSVFFKAYLRNLFDFNNSYFEARQFSVDINKIRIGGYLNLNDSNELGYAANFSQTLCDLSILFYDIVRPSFVCIDNETKNDILSRDIINLRLPAVGWINLWGPSYIEKFGEEFLLGMPAFKIEKLADGGIYHQLSPQIFVDSISEAKEIHSKVIEYCSSHSYFIKCYAPYFTKVK
jgi:hypothetical protein